MCIVSDRLRLRAIGMLSGGAAEIRSQKSAFLVPCYDRISWRVLLSAYFHHLAATVTGRSLAERILEHPPTAA
jgi:hypothetical protein